MHYGYRKKWLPGGTAESLLPPRRRSGQPHKFRELSPGVWGGSEETIDALVAEGSAIIINDERSERMSEARSGIPMAIAKSPTATERPTTDVPIYSTIIGQDKALTLLEDTVNSLLTTVRGTEYGSKTGKDPNETPPGSIAMSVTDIAARILVHNEIIETMSKQIDEITDELGRVRIGMGI